MSKHIADWRNQPVTFFARSLLLAAGVISVLLAALADAAHAATITLSAPDAVGTSSFNTGLNWSNHAAPVSSNDYMVSISQLRSPPDGNSYTFGGRSLTINTNGSFFYKGTGSTGTITVANLILNSGTMIHNQSSSDVFWLYGNLNVAAGSWIYAKQGPIAIVAPIGGNGKITNPGADASGNVLYLFNGANTYTGSIVNNGNFYLVSGANLNFVIGASGVNNSVSGTGSTTIDGRFVLNLSGASTNLGDSWTIASASGQSFTSDFSVDGFTRQGGGTGSGLWDVQTNGVFYEFSTASGVLSVVAQPSTNVVMSPPGFTAVQTTYIPISDGGTNSGYGYAGTSDNAVNAVPFICSGLQTVSNQQFIAYYGQDQTNPSYPFNGTIWIGRRSLSSNTWDIFRTTLTPDDITDGHDVVSFGIDGAGYMHLSWGMHNQALNYAVSTGPVTGSGTIAFGAKTTMTGCENSVTYPQFLTMPNGDLLYLYRVGGPGGGSGGGDTYLNRYLLATHTWTNVNMTGGLCEPFIKGYWSSATNYNAYPNMPCLDGAGNLYVTWCWRETPAYQSNHDLFYARSSDDGVTWQRTDASTYTLPISQYGVNESGSPNSIAQKIVGIPQNYSLINQAGMCLDGNTNPVIATWWAPGTPTNNFQRQYMVVFPDSNGIWQTRQISNRTNDPPGTLEQDGAVRDLGRPVVVADKQNRIIVIYRDNFGSNSLTVVHSLPYTVDPLRTNWTTVDLTTDNLGSYEPVIDLARWQRDNVLDVLCQPSTGEGYTAPSNTASPIGVLEWNAAAYFNPMPTLQMAFTNSNQNVTLTWPSQTGWGYELQTSTNLPTWSALTTLSGNETTLQYVHTNAATVPARFWRLQIREGGLPP